MKTTLNIRDDLVAQAKAAAIRESTTLTKMVEEGLALRLRRHSAPFAAQLKDLPVSPCLGGVRDGIDATSNRSMLDATDE